MDAKQMLDKLLEHVPEDERQEVLKKLVEAETTEERVEIVRKYADEDLDTDAVPDWLKDSYELSDEDLNNFAGGSWEDFINYLPA